VPSDAPDGTQVLNIPPGDGRSGYFRVTFKAPAYFSSVDIEGGANIDDTGIIFLNGQPLSQSVFDKNPISEFANATFSYKNFRKSLINAGDVNEILVSDLNTGGGPSGAAFYLKITFRP
jgi:hypothetical protein